MSLDSITCPVCNLTSYTPTAIRGGYCPQCRAWTTPVLTVREWDRVGPITPGDRRVPRGTFRCRPPLGERLAAAVFCPACLLPRFVPGHRLRGCR